MNYTTIDNSKLESFLAAITAFKQNADTVSASTPAGSKHRVVATASFEIASLTYTDAVRHIYIFDSGEAIEHIWEHDDSEGHKETNNTYRLLVPDLSTDECLDLPLEAYAMADRDRVGLVMLMNKRGYSSLEIEAVLIKIVVDFNKLLAEQNPLALSVAAEGLCPTLIDLARKNEEDVLRRYKGLSAGTIAFFVTSFNSFGQQMQDIYDAVDRLKDADRLLAIEERKFLADRP